jgi:hypothetical protein
MAKKNEIRFDGIEDFSKVLNDLGGSIEKTGQLSALNKAANPIWKGAREEVKKYAKGTDKDGFSKLLMLAALVVKRRYKGGITIQWKKGDDIPIKGLKGRDRFSAFGYARLMAQGRKWTSKTTESRKQYKTGQTQGLGDFIDEAFERYAYQAISIFKKERIPQIQKAMERSVRKYMKNNDF